MPDPLPLYRLDAPRAAALACLWLALAVVACSEDEPCNLCPGTVVTPVDECPGGAAGYQWEIEIEGELYELVCGGPDVPNVTPVDYDRIVDCDGMGTFGLFIRADPRSVRVTAASVGGNWHTDGWQVASPANPDECGGCQDRTISVVGQCGPVDPDASN
jgi:hypothetical protein